MVIMALGNLNYLYLSFDPVFLPDGMDKTLAEVNLFFNRIKFKPDEISARFKVIENFINKKSIGSYELIKDWRGEWQN